MMKTLKKLFFVAICCGMVMACGDNGSSQSDESTDKLSSSEKAELVAAALTSKEGGIGQDFENITQPDSQEKKGLIGGDLNVDFTMEFYDKEGAVQDGYSTATTNSILYNSQIHGKLSVTGCYFQEMILDNQSHFTVDDMIEGEGMAIIDGTHHLHSSYTRNSSLTGTEVSFSLDCDLTVTGVTVKMNEIDIIPDTGTVEGSIAGSYVRNGVLADIAHQVSFGFNVTYMGNNTAEIELDGDVTFSLNLESGVVVEIEI